MELTEQEAFAIVDRHFAFENPELIHRIAETFASEVIWESPIRNIVLTEHKQIVDYYHKIANGMLNPKIEVLRRFAHGDELFDDRIIYFTAGENNVWGVIPDRKVKLRLVHYFKVKDNKICHEIGYEIINLLD